MIAAGINLAHTGIEQGQNLFRAGHLGHRFKAGHRHEWNIGRYRQALGNAAGNAQTGKGAGANAKGNGIELRDF